MNAEEAMHLCRLAKTISPAQAVEEYTPAAWALILEDCRFEDARQALKELGGEQEWIHVSHIVKRVKRTRAARVAEAGPLTPPPDLSPIATNAWLAQARRRIGDGEPVEVVAPPRELTARDMGALPPAKSVDAELGVKSLRAGQAEAKRRLQEREAEKEADRRRKQAEREEARRLDREARENNQESA